MQVSKKPKSESASPPAGSSHKAIPRRTLSCLLCQQRKIKCDRKEPCSNCIKARVECVSAAAMPPRARKRRFPEAELLARIRRYEDVLQKYGIDVEELNNEATVVTAPVVNQRKDTSKDESTQGKRSKVLSLGRNPYNGRLSKDEFQYTEELLEGSSEDEIETPRKGPITRTWDSLCDDSELLLVAQPSSLPLTGLHPEPVQIFRLWQTFLDNVNPLLKIFHAPTVQLQILDATANLNKISIGTEALMFAIYAFAILSLDFDECKRMFGDRNSLLRQYQVGAAQALLKAGFLKSSDITVLQALVLHLQTIRKGCDPRSLFNLTGICVRNGQRLGLHRDGATQGRSVFEVEMRRRLWWQIIILDTRIAEFSGVGTAITTSKWNTRLPLNVNDSDLSPNMQEPPVEHTGTTEMLFCLIRCEIASFLGALRAEGTFDGHWNELSSSTLSLASKETALSRLEETLEKKYLSKCDSQVPLHVMAKSFATMATSKLRLIAYHPRLLPDNGAGMTPRTRDLLFKWALSMMDQHNILLTHPAVRRYLWLIHVSLPVDANIFILTELRHRTSGELAERAWEALAQANSYLETPSLAWDVRKQGSGIHLAFCNLVFKAWEARDPADKKSPPDFIKKIMDQFDSIRNQQTSSGTTNSLSSKRNLERESLFNSGTLDGVAPLLSNPGLGQPPASFKTSQIPATSQALLHHPPPMYPLGDIMSVCDASVTNMDSWSWYSVMSMMPPGNDSMQGVEEGLATSNL